MVVVRVQYGCQNAVRHEERNFKKRRTQAFIDAPETRALVVAAIQAPVRLHIVTHIKWHVGIDKVAEEEHEVC